LRQRGDNRVGWIGGRNFSARAHARNRNHDAQKRKDIFAGA